MKRTPPPNIFSQPLRPAQPVLSSAVERQIALNQFAASQFSELETFCQDLTRRYPLDGFGWKLLGAAAFKLGRTQDALEPMKRAANYLPQDWEAFAALGMVYQALGDFDHAAACLEHALVLNPNHVDSLNSMAELMLDHGRREDALVYQRRKLALVPDDGYCAHMVAMLSGQHTDHAPEGYVTRVFDGYADRFDEHLASLHYTAPQQLANMVSTDTPACQNLDILDLGCGTGMSALPFVPMARSLCGVDLSAGMLARARQRGVYQRLVQSDVLKALQAEPDASFDLVVSADVYIYVGELDAVLAEVRRVLKPGGRHAFSVEHLPEPAGQDIQDFQLAPSGRYSHAFAYLHRLADRHGFTVRQETPITLRLEHDVPVAGRLHLWA